MIEAKKQTSPSKSSDDYLCYEWDHNQVTTYALQKKNVNEEEYILIKICKRHVSILTYLNTIKYLRISNTFKGYFKYKYINIRPHVSIIQNLVVYK